ncbi:MAG TPA: zinc ABC transporter solute-binding protein [Candidatus Hydrogenedentes bacterium]|nr:zinc ABC transporter solute-binding protein [Candidatus Hydrogenedentota bacterium]HIJ73589.1 zinc ABC transporter solute-binding protein [Candidatus Hydrogenedentota bacterium]
MRCSICGLISTLLLSAILGCSEEDNGGKLAVFVSVPPQAHLVKRIGGDHVAVQVLVRPGQEPHTFEPTPKQAAALAKTRLFFVVGLPFEERVIAKVRSGDLAFEVVNATVLPNGENHAGSPKREAEEAARGSDPHVWLSPRHIETQVRNITRALTRTDPSHAPAFEANCARLLDALADTDASIRQQLAPYAGRSFYVFHACLGHFAEAYGLHQEAIEFEGKSPGPRQLRDLVAKAKRDRAKCIFVQPQFDEKSARIIAAAIGADIVLIDPLAEDVFENLEEIASKIVKAFG